MVVNYLLKCFSARHYECKLDWVDGCCWPPHMCPCWHSLWVYTLVLALVGILVTIQEAVRAAVMPNLVCLSLLRAQCSPCPNHPDHRQSFAFCYLCSLYPLSDASPRHSSPFCVYLPQAPLGLVGKECSIRCELPRRDFCQGCSIYAF